ncbi:MAG: ribonuclease P protein component [Clostridia bacterium]|nr:ribonuclease P protein component [Clostridia bacterium]
MKREDALKKKKEFRYTYRVGKSTSNRLFTAVIAPRHKPETLVGISVSKKQGNAVERNRIKRRLREAVTPLVPELKKGNNIILVARRGVLEEPFPSLCASARKLLQKAGAFRLEEKA